MLAECLFIIYMRCSACLWKIQSKAETSSLPVPLSIPPTIHQIKHVRPRRCLFKCLLACRDQFHQIQRRRPRHCLFKCQPASRHQIQQVMAEMLSLQVPLATINRRVQRPRPRHCLFKCLLTSVQRPKYRLFKCRSTLIES